MILNLGKAFDLIRRLWEITSINSKLECSTNIKSYNIAPVSLICICNFIVIFEALLSLVQFLFCSHFLLCFYNEKKRKQCCSFQRHLKRQVVMSSLFCFLLLTKLPCKQHKGSLQSKEGFSSRQDRGQEPQKICNIHLTSALKLYHGRWESVVEVLCWPMCYGVNA